MGLLEEQGQSVPLPLLFPVFFNHSESYLVNIITLIVIKMEGGISKRMQQINIGRYAS